MRADGRRNWRHPIFVDLAGRTVVVIGGGAVAEKRIAALIETGTAITVVSPEVTQSVARWAESKRLTLQLRRYRRGDLRGACLAYAATSDPSVNRAVRFEAETERIWLNAVDRPELCDFITPAVIDRGHLTIAISTNGRCPALAQRMREDLDRELGPDYAVMAERLGEFRDVWKADGMSGAALAQHVRLALDALRVSRGKEPANRRVESLDQPPISTMSADRPDHAKPTDSSDRNDVGKVYLVGAGPGDPDLLTVKGRRLLERADTVVYDALVDPRLLELCPPASARIYVGKREGCHSRPQPEINTILIEEARAGRIVVRLKGGDPFVFGRGGEEAEALAREGIGYEVVPGVSAGVAVPAYAGIPLTHRDVVSEVVFVTGHACGTNPSPVDWSRYGRSAATLVIFMGLHNLGAIAQHLLDHGRDRTCPAAVIENGTTACQRTIVAPLDRIAAEAAAAGIRPPAVIVVGEVVRLRDNLQWFEPKTG